MFERFVAFLDSIGGGSSGSRDESTPLQLASAAILFAVMDPAGVRHEPELAALRETVSERVDLEGAAPQAATPPAAKQRLLGLEFRSFVNYFMRLPALVVKTGRRTVVRLLAWNAWLPEFVRLAERLRRPAPSYRPRC